MYKRKTEDGFIIYGNFGYGKEEMCSYVQSDYNSPREMHQSVLHDLKEYRFSGQGTYEMKRTRFKLEEAIK